MEQESICFYHDDADGIVSAAIINKVYPDCEFVRMQYGYDEKKFEFEYAGNKYDYIFVVDFSFTKYLMNVLQDMSIKEFVWIDHHKSAKEELSDLWDSNEIGGIRSLENSGCGLTWKWFNPNEDIPEVVKLVEDYDLWKFKYGVRTKAFGEMSFKLTDPKLTILSVMLENNKISKSLVEEYVQKGNILMDAKQTRIEKAFKSGLKITFHGYNTILCNSNNDVSNLGNYCCKQGYGIGLVWSLRKDKIIFGLRSIGDIDVSSIAKEYGGGGHKNASGFNMDLNKGLEFLMRLLK